MSHFPSRDLDEPVTKDFHRAETGAPLRAAEMAELRTEMAELRTELRDEIGRAPHRDARRTSPTLRIEMHQGFAAADPHPGRADGLDDRRDRRGASTVGG